MALPYTGRQCAIRSIRSGWRLRPDSGALRNPAFLLEMLPDTALRRRAALPDRIAWEGSATAEREVYSLASVLTAGPGRRKAGETGTDGARTGRIALQGRFDTPRKAYEATIRCDSFPVGEFSAVRFARQARSNARRTRRRVRSAGGRNPGRVRLEVARAEYRGHDFGGVRWRPDLRRGRLTGRIEDRDSVLRLALGIEGQLTRERQQARMTGQVGWFDLAALGLVAEPIGGMFHLDAEAAANAPDVTTPASPWTASPSGTERRSTGSFLRAQPSTPIRRRPGPRCNREIYGWSSAPRRHSIR